MAWPRLSYLTPVLETGEGPIANQHLRHGVDMKRKPTYKVLLAGFMVAAGPCTAFGQGMMPDSAPTSSSLATKPNQNPADAPTQKLGDAQILMILLAANTGEIEQADLAEDMARSKEVIAFAKKMIEDHSKANQNVQDVQARLGLKSQSSATRDQIDNMVRESLDRLKSTRGLEFEKAYLNEQAVMHQTFIGVIDKHLMPNANAPQIKTLLTKIRGTVASHMDHVKRLRNSAAAM